MKVSSRAVAIVIAALCFFAASACAVRTTVNKVPLDEVRANLQYQNVVFRNFTALPEVQSPDAALATCKASAVDYLKAQNVFRNVEKESSRTFNEPTMIVDVKLENLRIVSGAARFWAGGLAGRSYMKIAVRLLDSNGSLVAEQELEGAPDAAGSAWSFGGTDRGLPGKMGVLLGDYVLANVSKKSL